MTDKLEQFQKDLAEGIAGSMGRLGDRVRDLDWYAGNLFPEEDAE